jgi:hypothetical protein
MLTFYLIIYKLVSLFSFTKSSCTFSIYSIIDETAGVIWTAGDSLDGSSVVPCSEAMAESLIIG